ncbi:hypothetical protein ACFVRB_33085 [Streptomyces nojiriensis]|uniref:hypothetical protein n=1 Tax=Streptomyces nojiriensis TaxID=66374 RepID=UPI0036DF3A32
MKITTAYQEAIDGTLCSQYLGVPVPNLAFFNGTEIPLDVYLLSDKGSWLGGPTFAFPGGHPIQIAPQETWGSAQGVDFGWWFIFLNSYSGAFVAVQRAGSAVPWSGLNLLSVTCEDLLNPNNIGTIPKPNVHVLIPPDSPRVTVGCGNLPTGCTVAREQYWQRLPNSYSLSAGARRQVSYTVTSGMESTSSDQDQFSTSVTGSASAGWGPVSATVSASLSANSTRFQQVTTSLETTSFVSQECVNAQQEVPETFFYWQLTDVLTVFDPSGTPVSSMIYGSQGPAVIDGPHHPRSLPPRPLDKVLPMSEEMEEQVALVSVTARDDELVPQRDSG